jgi:phosphatidylserine/phosphatidylglycerophosphate/cardiolipin synthase-like enzyme
MDVPTLLETLLAAAGFTGALTLVVWVRWLRRRITPPPGVDVKFSPKGGCSDAVVRELAEARESVRVMAFSFTHDPIVDALIAAHRRGVKVEIILDKDNEEQTYSDLPRVMSFGVPILIDDKHAIAHNKVILIDRRVIITGSYNFTAQAENGNAENLVILKHHPDLVAQYHRNFDEHKAHSRAPTPRPEAGTADKGRRAA